MVKPIVFAFLLLSLIGTCSYAQPPIPKDINQLYKNLANSKNAPSRVNVFTLLNNNDQYNQLTIADDGPGLPSGFDFSKIDSLGINLMRGLCKQLDVSLTFSSGQGCTINMIFKTEIFNRG